MAELGLHGLLLLMISLTKYLEGTKLLAGFKKCGDLECETLISRAFAVTNYRGPDCRFLNFTEGDEISVYVKLTGEREDLWAGSKGKDFGYFPKDAVRVEEVFIHKEVEISTKESDFFCLLEKSYIFGNEENEQNTDSGENIFPYKEDEDQSMSIYESDFQIESGYDQTSKSTLFEDQFPPSEAPEDIRRTSTSKDWEGVEIENVEQNSVPEKDHKTQFSSVPEGKQWFEFKREQTKGLTFEAVTKLPQEISFQSRKMAVGSESDAGELNIGDSQMEHIQEPEPEFDLMTKKQSELESEKILEPQTTHWFDGGFKTYLGFGSEDTEFELPSQERNPPLEDVPNSVPSDEEATVPCTEIKTETEKKDSLANGSSIFKPSWLDFGFGMLAFAYANEDKSISDAGKNKEGGEGDKHEHLPNELDLDKEQEEKIIKTIETDDQTVNEIDLNKADDSDAMAYFQKIFNNFDNPWNFQNNPNEIELPFPELIQDEDQVSKRELPKKINEDMHFKNYDEKSKILDYEDISELETDILVENALLNSELFSTGNSLSSHKEDTSEYQILKYLFQFDVYGIVSSAFSPIGMLIEMVVATLPEDMRPGPNLYGFPWDLVICVAIIGIFAVLLLLWRSFRSVRSRLYLAREKKLAVELSSQIEKKCNLLEKVSLLRKEYEGLEPSLKDASLEESAEAQSLEEMYEKLNRTLNLKLEEEILSLEEQLKEREIQTFLKQDELMVDISNKIQSLEDESKLSNQQVAETKTTFKIFQMNEERLKNSIKDAVSENSQLLESQKQLFQEVETWKEQVNELDKQKKIFEASKVDTEKVHIDKENQIKSLTERLMKMKDWATVLGEDIKDDDNLELELKSESENENLPKGALKKLIYAAKLNASLQTLEGERNQIYTQLSEIDNKKEELTEYIKNLQAEQASLQLENTQFESENQKLQQKLKVMTELYQENEMTLHRKLTVEENYRLEKEEKLSKADEKISYAAEELEMYRKRAKDLEEELERTIHSYQGQVISHEKKAHDNWLAARTAERNLSDLKKENAHNRQKLTETELKFELLEKDPYAFDVPNTAFGREHSPYGPSPLGRPSSETRAFLSPPTLLEGPLRLSPLLPGGGGRGSRGPGNLLDHHMTNERGDLSDRLTDPQRASSDTGSLSPPWDQDRRMMVPPSGHPCPDPAFPPQRQDRFYSNSGRLSGPAELRSFNMPSLDKTDGPISSEMECSRNDSKDDIGNLNVPEPPLSSENEAAGPGFFPPPPHSIRGPMFPMDARGPFMRRGPPFLPPAPGSMYGAPRDYFPPRDFRGPLPPPFPMRNVYARRGFPQYFPPRAGFFSPPPHP
ncbi:LOW QUALITY PROTEIN: melanoma inhibitory activity protein 2 [Suncus etruscus]|uniref:LOW QUALITY PROTEIN: melanoma inhibitory activity protein 2 n=1 Tax=Suncus etruscus TaxID=109475 RepID=UPI00210F9BED|nr:LOW QUALITY PROTEIN: melanoma inhibitory activity protein 2 [Suncus etruscus]